MRSPDQRNNTLFCDIRPDSQTPRNRPLRAICSVMETAMLYFRRYLIVCLIIYVLPGNGVGRTAGPDQPVNSVTLVAENPILASLARVAPARTPAVIMSLKQMVTGPQQELSRGIAMPTPAERADIAANPVFARAYDRYPVAALALLRSVKQTLRSAEE
jgi:hypothetical protein